jgi:CRISPR-associated protein Csx17
MFTPAPAVPGLDRRPLVDVLGDVLVERSIRATTRTVDGRTDDPAPSPGVAFAFDRGVAAPLDDIASWVDHSTDDRLLSEALQGALMLQYQNVAPQCLVAGTRPDPVMSPLYALLSSFACADSLRASRHLADGPRPLPSLRVETQWLRQLARGNPAPAIDGATSRLRALGLTPTTIPPGAHLGAARRVGAAMLIPVRASDARRLRRRVCPSANDPEANDNYVGSREDPDRQGVSP